MTMEQKIDEVLLIVRGERELMSKEREIMHEERKIMHEEHGFMREERMLNNSRFSQLSAGLDDVRKDVKDLKVGLATVDAKIDRVYDSLSQDIQIFAEDLHQVKRRVTRLEKKVFS